MIKDFSNEIKLKKPVSNDYVKLLDLAVRAAHCSASKIKQYPPSISLNCKTSNADLVSESDLVSERIIENFIKTERPEDGFLGEEGSIKPSISGLRWVCDPLDGTTNYLYRIPHWVISIACEWYNGEYWQAVVGTVFDVIRDEIFTAIRGGGAYMNNVAISVNLPEKLSNALIATEFSYCLQSRVFQAQVLSEVLPKVRDIRSSGSSVLDLCWVAAGRLDGFYENELSHWDLSAASLIIEEAGGIVSTLGTGVVAGALGLQQELLKLVNKDQGVVSIEP